MSAQPTADEAREAWRCPRCGSERWVAVSLDHSWTRTVQCVPCGRYDDTRASDLEARRWQRAQAGEVGV